MRPNDHLYRHPSLEISFVRSISMDKWKEIELKKMKVGGNRRAREFFNSQSDWDWNAPLSVRYNSKAAALYRDKVSIFISHVLMPCLY